MNEVKKIKPSGIFTNYIYKTIPLSFDESMSYYETLLGVLKLLKNQEIVINNNADLLAELESYVKNYFNNLDVQEEINNKLDEMVEDGTLQEIITDYLNSKAIFGFDNVASMKTSTNLIDGSYAKTLGYYDINDGGSALYKITETTPIGLYYETLNSGLYAVLINFNKANVAQYGVSPDNEDNTTQLNTAFQYNEILEGINATIKIKDSVNIIHNNINYDFKNMTIEANASLSDMVNVYSNNSTRIKGIIKNLNIDGKGLAEYGLSIYDTQNTYFDNINVTSNTVAEIYVVGAKNTTGCNLTLQNCRLENGRKHNLSDCENAIALKLGNSINDSYFNNIVTFEYAKHIENHGLNWFNKIHSWNYNYVLNSIMFDTYSSIMLDNIMCDTLETLMKINNSGNIAINNSRVFVNTSANVTGLIPKPFICLSDFTSNNGRLRISNSVLSNYGGGNNDLITLPVSYTKRLNMINISNCYTSNYKLEPYYTEYNYKTLTLDFTDYSVINHLEGTETMKLLITHKGNSEVKLQLYSNSLTITAKTWTSVCKITDSLFIVANRVTTGLIFNSSDGVMYPIRWRINASNEVQLYVQDNLPALTGFTIYLDSFFIIDQNNNN